VIPLGGRASVLVGTASVSFFELATKLAALRARELSAHRLVDEFATVTFGDDAIE
jgi:hypothetical protein